MNTQKKTLETIIIESSVSNESFPYAHLDHVKAIAEIQELVRSAIPEKKTITKDMEAELGEDYPYYEHGYNQAITDITTALVEVGLLKGEGK